MKNQFFRKGMFAAMATSFLLVACSDDNQSASISSHGEVRPYVIAATVATSNAETTVLLNAESLDEGTVSAVDNGLVTDAASYWVFHGNKTLYGLAYNQGNAGLTRSFVMDENYNIVPRESEYAVNRFTTYGIYKDYIITSSTGNGDASWADEYGYLPKMFLFSYLDTDAETYESNTPDKRHLSEDFLDNGEYVTLAGFQQRGEKLLAAVVPMGLSQYGAAVDNGKYVEYSHLVKSEDGGSNSSSYKKGELQWTQYPDECNVAIFDDALFTDKKIITTDKMSYACGRYKSQYYQMIWATENGDVYVFSPSYAKTMTAPEQRTRHAAAVMRIKAGEEQFDEGYYVDIEALSEGRSFMRSWYIGDGNFLLQMYDTPFTAGTSKGLTALSLAVFNVADKTLKNITGLPETISSFGTTPFMENGYAYMPVSTTDGYPALWKIDSSAATAVKGVTVEVTSLKGVGKLLP